MTERGATLAAAVAAEARRARRSLRLLGLAAAAGAALGVLAARGAGGAAASALPGDAIASVNGAVLLEREYARALELFAGDRREAPDARDRAHVLARLVDEELLVQHALASGLLASDRALRDAVVRAMVDAIVAERAGRAPGDDELRALQGEALARGGPGVAALRDFESARSVLESMHGERAREHALREYLDALRATARIELAEDGAR